MARVAVVSYRLGAADGVSVEAAKWVAALAALGHAVTTVAGEGASDVRVEGLGRTDLGWLDEGALSRVLGAHDVAVVENLTSLPLNPRAVDALLAALEGRPAIFRHHDLAWQRPAWRDAAPPPTSPRWRHVTINELSRRELAERGVDATTIYNAFDVDPPAGDRATTRARLRVGDERLALMPSRAIPRKNVPGALALAEALDATLWILGAPEDGYDSELTALIAASPARVIRGSPRGVGVHDAYAAADLVVVASTWEGFGNPVIESVTHDRPLAVHPYPVLAEITATGLSFLALGDTEGVARELAHPDRARRDANLAIVRERFNLADLPARVAAVLGEVEP
jgi:mannosylglucosylglycerate synthase